MTKIRDARWDNYKALLAFLMVYGHTFRVIIGNFPKMGGVFIFIYLFHMPAFLFVSGMFSKRAAEQNDSRRLISLLVQYLLVKAVLWASGSVIHQEITWTKLFTETGVAWFALSTMECLFLTMLLKNVDRKYVFVLSIIIGCACGYCTDIGGFLSLSRTLVYFPYFYLGYCLHADDMAGAADRKWVRAVSLLFLAGVFAVCVIKADALYPYYQFIKAKAPYSDYTELLGHASLGAVYRLAFYAVGFAMVLAFLFIMPKKHIPVISGIGSRTLAIYVFHFALVNFAGKDGWLKQIALDLCGSTWQIALFYLMVSAVIVGISSLPPLERFARWITAVPLRKENPKQEASVIHEEQV